MVGVNITTLLSTINMIRIINTCFGYRTIRIRASTNDYSKRVKVSLKVGNKSIELRLGNNEGFC